MRPLRALGRISYGVYVYHWPLFLWLDHDRTGLSPLPLSALRFVTTIALATISYVLLERPIRTRAWTFGRRAWVVAVAGVLSVVVASAAVAATAPALAVNFAPLQSPAAVIAATPKLPPTTARKPGVKPRPTPRLRRIMIVGDSVALTLGRAIERWARTTTSWCSTRARSAAR